MAIQERKISFTDRGNSHCSPASCPPSSRPERLKPHLPNISSDMTTGSDGTSRPVPLWRSFIRMPCEGELWSYPIFNGNGNGNGN